ncbi:hypothetical protein FACS1894190_06850 [Spirochaetia bacterium]|nr:hypothetical protein FACS1894190_06850 [Spirochaetia bacterium]
MSEFEKIFDGVKNTMLPFESWEKLQKETSAAFAAFCVFRDCGADRTIKGALQKSLGYADTKVTSKQYQMWRVWSATYQWFKRAADYDVYLDRIKQAEHRKTIEQREEAYRETTGKMLLVTNKKLDLMLHAPEELTQGNIKEWVETAIKTERDLFSVVDKESESGDTSGKFAVNFQKAFENL